MLKKRIIPKILLKKKKINGKFIAVSILTKLFTENKIIGNPVNQAKIFNDNKADEIIIIDLDHNFVENVKLKVLEDISQNVFTPISVGGGIKSIKDIKTVLNSGADKVLINVNNINKKKSDFIISAIKYFGSQCITASVDIIKVAKKYYLYNYENKKKIILDTNFFFCKLRHYDFGEIIVNDVGHDGMKNGIDDNLLIEIKKIIKVPFIFSCGINAYEDFEIILKKYNIDAAAAGTFFSQHDQSIFQLKNYLHAKGVKIRLDY